MRTSAEALTSLVDDDGLRAAACASACFGVHRTHRRAVVCTSAASLRAHLERIGGDADDAPLPAWQHVVLLLSSEGEPLLSLIDRLSNDLPRFAAYFGACADRWPAGRPGLDRFGCAYALARLLDELGVPVARMLGGGAGQHVMSAVRGRQTLDEAIAAAAASDVAAVPDDLHQRMRGVLDRDASLGHRLYLELGTEGVLSRALRACRKEQDAFDVLSLTPDGGLHEVVAALYERHVPLAWEGVHAVICQHEPAADGEWPLSHGQRRLWMMHELGEVPGLYSIPAALLVDGALRRSALENALLGVLDRHDALRTTLNAPDGEPRQHVAPMDTLEPGWFDTAGPFDEAAARAYAMREALRPFDLTRAPLIRVRLVSLTDGRHLLFVNMHHIASDGWSLGVLVRELASRYAAIVSGARPDTAPLPSSYRAFAVREDLQVRGGLLADDRAFWREALSPLPEPLELPTDYPRPTAKSYRGGFTTATVDAPIVAALAAVCQRQGATLFGAFVAAVKTLCFRYSGQRDITVGTPMAGRGHSSVEGLIGFFVNTVPVRTRIDGGTPFTNLLQQVTNTLVAAQEHQAYPFDCMVEDLDVRHKAGRHPLFDVLVEHVDMRSMALALPGCAVHAIDCQPALSKFDLAFTWMESDGGVAIRIGYDAALFDDARIARLGRHLTTLLREVANDPAVRLGEVPLSDEGERRQLAAFSGIGTVPATEDTLVSLFERQAAATPNRIAVSGRGTLTYAELNDAANRVAVSLISQGVRTDDRVGLLLERSELAIVAMLGAMKAGGAYVPLDVSDPPDRIRRIIEDAACRVVIGEADIEAALREAAPVRLPAVLPDNLAYVIFTSGSTGRPNGVMVSHRSVVCLVRDLHARLVDRDDEPCNIAVVASFSFDASVQQIFPALLRGDTLHVVGDDTKRSPERFWRELADREVHAVDCTPSLLSVLIDGPDTASPQLRQLIVGGEPLSPSLAVCVATCVPSAAVFNAYGPTETCVDATLHAVAAADLASARAIPIGSPLAGSSVRVLDAELQVAPVGVAGELFIGGPKLARGYVGNPRLTAERFIPSPFGKGDRLYKTGDQGRWRDDGSIEFLGRADHQVKIRGHRVELGEIEHVLRRIAEAADAVVVVHGDDEQKRLVAYIRSDAVLDVDAVRSFLADALPSYMIPSRIVVLREFPMTASGKIDRRALPDPGEAGVVTRTRALPTDASQEALVRIWEAVLRTAPIGVTDNFFEIGGDSIRAMQLVSRLTRGGWRCELRDLFEAPTIAALASRLTREVAPAVVARKSARPGAYPLSPLQEGLLFRQMLDPESLDYVEQVSVRLAGPLDARRVAAVWQHLVERFEILRTNFEFGPDGQPRQVVHTTGAVEVDADASRHRRPFDLAREPLTRLALVPLGDDEHELVWTFPHIILDGWSAAAILQAFLEVDAQLARDESVAPVTIRPYGEYAEALATRDRDSAARYWSSLLDGCETVASIPVSEPSALAGTTLRRQHAFRLDAGATSRLKAFAADSGVTLNTVIQTMWGVLLSGYNDAPDVVFGATVSVRDADFEDTPGLFINTIPVRVTSRPRSSVSTLLRQVQEQALASRTHSWMGLHEIQQLTPLRDRLFNHILIFENYPLDDLGAGYRLGVQGIRVEEQIHYDLAMLVTPGDELSFLVHFDAAVHSLETIVRLESHVRTCLEALPSAAAVGDVTMLSSGEHAALQRFAAAGATRPAATVLEAFDAVVACRPHDVALRCGARAMTYGELHEASERLAGALHDDHGVRPEDRVALLLPRSEELVVAMLGALRAGAAFVPIDPQQPAHRIQHVLEDAGVRVALQSPLRGTHGFQRQATSDQAAYVMYTSGSTGMPKGVVVTHGNLAAFSRSLIERFELTTSDRLLATTTVGFDISLLELLCAVAMGIEVEVAPQEMLDSPEDLVGRLERGDISILQLTPSRLRQLLECGGPEWVARLRVLLVGGEALPPDLATTLRAVDGPRVFNVYGPTEATIWATSADVISVSAGIGRPLPGYDIHVRSFDDRLAPIGVGGEICIGGAAVARGYIARPRLTAERFVPDPFVPGGRLYRTGDRGRWSTSGDLVFLGRRDRQVKIRGHRVECGEVEAHLAAHPAVQEAVVVPKALEGGEVALVAYVRTRERTDSDGLRAFLRARLPEAMVPAFVVAVEEFPRTRSQKIDVNALPAPTSDRPGATFVAPSTSLERAIAAIWQEVLGIERIGVHDDFFALGGHSLTATRAIVRLRRQLAADIPLAELFRHPTIAALARVLASAAAREAPIDPVEQAPDYPLSFAQRRMLVLHQLDPTGTAYSMPVAVRLGPGIDVDALRAAFDALGRRHAVLRSTIALVNGEPRTVIKDDPVQLQVERTPETLEAFAKLAASQPFNLIGEPLLRGALVSNGTDERLLFINVHHIVCDGWSVAILAEELAALYEGRALPTPRIQHPDFVAWQAAQLLTSGEADRRYWLTQLAQPHATADLPLDRPRPALRTFTGERVAFELDAALVSSLRQVGAASHATPFMTFTAGISLLLARYTGSHDVIVGTPVSGRVHPDLEHQVGLYVNTVALRNHISREDRVADVIAAVRSSVTDAFAHQGYPFDKLVDELALDRDHSRSPLFDAMVTFWDAAETRFRLTGVEAQPVEIPTYASKADLTFNFTQSGDRISCSIDYNSDLFERRRVERMGEHVVTLLRAFAADHEQPAWSIDLLSPSERHELLVAFNPQTAVASEPLTLVDAFARQVQKTPHRVAVAAAHRRLTFAELDAVSDRISAGLEQRLGIRPDDVVAIALERDERAIAAIVGVVKAGAAYLPIDPDGPAERVAMMLSDARARLVIADRPLPGAPVLSFDELLGAPPLRESRRARIDERNLAYVLFTSGSTGRPKGAAIDHRAVMRLVQALQPHAYDDVPDGAPVALLAALTFDASVQQIFPALLGGYPLSLVPSATKQDPALLHRFLLEQEVAVTDCTPTSLAALLDVHPHLPALRRVLVGGEPLAPAQARRFYDVNPHARLVNVYGLTECCVDSTAFGVTGQNAVIPIGRPLANAHVHVLDDTMQMLPVGVPGEIYIGGPGLARGYVHQSRLTADRFVPSPFADGERLYRTGDRGRWRVDGTLEFLGRLDRQVKIRGHRIECGEIEQAILDRVPGVAKVAVDVKSVTGEPELVAYMESTASLAVAGVRERLHGRLPDYMVPTRFVTLDRLPLMPSGKVDRRALPDPRGLEIETGAAFIAPASELERVLVAAWTAVLGRDPIGVGDNFFDLGGDSIKALQVVARLHQSGVSCPLRDLFLYPTIAELAVRVTPVVAGTEADIAIGRVPLTPIQRWFVEELPAARRHFNQSVMLIARARLDVAALERALSAVLSHHDALRAVFRTDGNDVVQTIVDTMSVAVTVRESLDGHDSRFDVEHGPLVRAIVLRGPAEDRLVIEIHHLVVDGVSWRILLEDLSLAYRDALAGRSITLPAKTTSFKTWAETIASSADDAALMDERDFWRETLRTSQPEETRDANVSTETDTRTVTLAAAETDLLLRQSNRAYTTSIDDLLLAAFSRALTAWNRQPRHLVYLEHHGRFAASHDVSRTVGWFTTVYPVALEGAEPDLGAHIRGLKESLRRVPRHGAGFGLLKYLRGEHLPDPLPRICFNYLGQFDAGSADDMFVLTDEQATLSQPPSVPPPFELAINAATIGGQLRVSATYRRAHFAAGSVDALLSAFIGALQTVVVHCTTQADAQVTPSDLTHSSLTLAELDEIVGGLRMDT